MNIYELNELNRPKPSLEVLAIQPVTATLFRYLNIVEIFRFLKTCKTFYNDENMIEIWLAKYDVKMNKINNKKLVISSINVKKRLFEVIEDGGENNSFGHINITSAEFSKLDFKEGIFSGLDWPLLTQARFLSGEYDINYDQLKYSSLTDEFIAQNKNINEINNYGFSVKKKDNDFIFGNNEDMIHNTLIKSTPNPFNDKFYKEIVDNSSGPAEATDLFVKFVASSAEYDIKTAIKYINFPYKVMKKIIEADIFKENFLAFYQRYLPADLIGILVNNVIKSHENLNNNYLPKKNMCAVNQKNNKNLRDDIDILYYTISLRTFMSEKSIIKNIDKLDGWTILREDMKISPAALEIIFNKIPTLKLLTIDWFQAAEYDEIRNKIIIKNITKK